MNIITRIFRKKDSPNIQLVTEIDMTLLGTYIDHAMPDMFMGKMVDKLVQETWKRHGMSLLKKVDKKTIGNLTVKKLSALIAKELKPYI